MNSDAIECLCLNVANKKSKTIIPSLNYWPQNGDTILLEKHMKSILSKNDAAKKEVILTADFTINLLDFDKNKAVQSFVNLMFLFGMIVTINKPTSVTRHTATAIDHGHHGQYRMDNTVMDNIEIKALDISNHFTIIVTTKNKIDAEILDQYIFECNISDQSINLSKNYAISNWNNIEILQNVKDAYSKFLKNFLSL